MIRVLRVLGYAAFGLGVLAYPLAFAMDRAAGIEALVVTASDDASVAANRGLWELDGKPKDGVAAIYGTPSKTPARLVGVPADRVLHPKEDPSLTLYLLRTGDHPLQAMTLYYFALPATLGGLVAGTALLWYVCRRKKSAPAAAATPAA